MPGLLERLGNLFGHHTEPPPADAPVATAEAPPSEEPVAVQEYPEPAPVAQEDSAPAPVAQEDSAPAPVEAMTPPATVAESSAPPPPAEAAAPVEQVAVAQSAVDAAPAEPVKSPEEQMEERLWAETEAAWGRQDFQKVTECLDALKAFEPEGAAAIDEKIAAAQYNHAAQLEQSGDLQRALFLYQDAQRRNPNLGEAAFAIERVQNALAPAPVEAAPAERTYTVEAGDSLWAIAEKFYGSGSDWSRILEANSDQITNPDAIQPGQTLRIP